MDLRKRRAKEQARKESLERQAKKTQQSSPATSRPRSFPPPNASLPPQVKEEQKVKELERVKKLEKVIQPELPGIIKVEEKVEKEKVESESNLFEKSVLKDLGMNLPIMPRLLGSEDDFYTSREFSFIDWDMELEEELAGLQSKCTNVGEFVNKLLAKLLDQFCGHDFQSLDEGKKHIMLHQLEFPNIMYMYIYLRCEELGPDLKFDLVCPYCAKDIKNFVGDLESLEVNVKNKDHERLLEYDLKRSIQIDDKKITGIKLDVSKWSSLQDVPQKDAGNSGSIKKHLFYSSIVGGLDSNGPIEGFIDNKTLVKKLKKVDIERITKLITDNNAGPQMSISGECPNCTNEFHKPIDWRYESFFDSSSI